MLLLIKEALSSLRVGSSELVSQAGLFVAMFSQESYESADKQWCGCGVKTIDQTFPNPSPQVKAFATVGFSYIYSNGHVGCIVYQQKVGSRKNPGMPSQYLVCPEVAISRRIHL